VANLPALSPCITGSNASGEAPQRKNWGFIDRKMHGTLANLRHERFAQALAQGKAANEAYALAGYRANDGNASRLKGNERISARVQEIVGRAAERAEVSLERSYGN